MNVVQLTTSPRVRAKQLRDRLWNPPNGNHSTELDVVTGTELRKRKAELAEQVEAQRAEAAQAEKDFQRQAWLAEMVQRAVAERARVKNIARKIVLDDQAIYTPKLGTIVNFVAEQYGVSRIDILSQRRLGNLIEPRIVAMYLATTLTFQSTTEIGRRIGDRDHSTVVKSVQRVKGWMAERPAFKAKIETFVRMLEAAHD